MAFLDKLAGITDTVKETIGPHLGWDSNNEGYHTGMAIGSGGVAAAGSGLNRYAISNLSDKDDIGVEDTRKMFQGIAPNSYNARGAETTEDLSNALKQTETNLTGGIKDMLQSMGEKDKAVQAQQNLLGKGGINAFGDLKPGDVKIESASGGGIFSPNSAHYDLNNEVVRTPKDSKLSTLFHEIGHAEQFKNPTNPLLKYKQSIANLSNKGDWGQAAAKGITGVQRIGLPLAAGYMAPEEYQAPAAVGAGIAGFAPTLYSEHDAWRRAEEAAKKVQKNLGTSSAFHDAVRKAKRLPLGSYWGGALSLAGLAGLDTSMRALGEDNMGLWEQMVR